MRPGPDAWQRPRIGEREVAREAAGPQDAYSLLSEEQRHIIAMLQTHQYGMTARQLEARLSWPRGGAQRLLEGLLERQLVARLNTVIPSYIYRYQGVDLDGD